MPTPLCLKCWCGGDMTLESGHPGQKCNFVCPRGHSKSLKPAYTRRFGLAPRSGNSEIKSPPECLVCHTPANQLVTTSRVAQCQHCGTRQEFREGQWVLADDVPA